MAAAESPRQPDWMNEALREEPWLRGLAGRIRSRRAEKIDPVRPKDTQDAFGDSDSRQHERELIAKSGKPIDTVELDDGELL